jgi:hypothetical protein
MKTFQRATCVLILLSAGSACVSAVAADTVYQRPGNTQSIELSNIDDVDAAQVPLVVDNKPARAATLAGAAQASPVDTPMPLRSKRSALARAQGKGTTAGEEEELADSSQPETTAVGAKDNVPAASAVDLPPEVNDNNGSSSMAYGGPGFAIGPSGATTSNPVSTGSTGTTGSSSSTGSTASTGSTVPATPSTQPGNTTATSTPKPRGDTGGSSTGSTAGLSTALQQYRQLMLQDATDPSLLLGNPATSRRYVMVDRTTYQSRIGQ